LKLLGSWVSPYTMRIHIAFRIKSVEYDYQEEDLSSKSQLLLNSNPVYGGKVPVLIHGDKTPIVESLIVLQYIDEVWTHGPQILPSDPHRRALARFWASYIDTKWFPATWEIIANGGENVEKQMREAREAMDFLENAFVEMSEGGKKKYFGGDDIGFLDIAVGSFIGWNNVANGVPGVVMIGEEETPNLFRWSQRFTDHPAVKGLVPEADKLAQYAKKF
ncbi:hypothetical protein M569_16433, partial [Genlisea aurea]